MKIQRKIFFLMVACVVISFLILSIITFYSKAVMYDEISHTMHEFSEVTASTTWTVLKNQVQENIEDLTVARANQIEDEIQDMRSDALKLSKKMSRIVSNLNQYSYRSVSDPRGQKVISGVPYILYSPENAYSRSAALEAEIGRVANIQDDLQDICADYEPYKNSCYIASEGGYFICVDYYPPEYSGNEDFIDADNTFDARQRPWYQKAAIANALTFSDVFLDTDNELSITCAAPYYYDNQFAGVIGIGVNISAWYHKIVKGISEEGRICFILSQNGGLFFLPSTREFWRQLNKM